MAGDVERPAGPKISGWLVQTRRQTATRPASAATPSRIRRTDVGTSSRSVSTTIWERAAAAAATPKIMSQTRT